MIIGFTGMPGAGKTYAVVARAHKAMKQGRMVFSNVYIEGTYKITFEDLITYRFPEGSLVIIDEAGRWFNSQKWKDLPDAVFDLFTMHRHLQMDLYICMQSFARVDKSLREVIELTYWAKNHPLLPFHKYEGFYDLEKVGSMRKEHDVQFFLWKSRKIRGLYNTHSMKNQFSHLESMPLNEWEVKKYISNKKFFDILKQKRRIKKKRKEREKRKDEEFDKQWS